jgi:hypothetical protein
LVELRYSCHRCLIRSLLKLRVHGGDAGIIERDPAASDQGNQ